MATVVYSLSSKSNVIPGKKEVLVRFFHGKFNQSNDSKDLMTTPQGTREKKKCYWLNRKYVLSEIINL